MSEILMLPKHPSKCELAELEAIAKAFRAHPKHDSIELKYRIVTDGKYFRVQRHQFLWFWRQVSGTLDGYYLVPEIKDSTNLREAENAIKLHVFQEIEALERKRHGWKVESRRTETY